VGRETAPIVATALLAWFTAPGPADAQAVPEHPLPAPSPPAAASPDGRPAVPPFLEGTGLTLRLRTYYADVHPPRGLEREALATGGWLAYQSRWFADLLQLGATLYASVPVHAPENKAETLLLAPGRGGYRVLGVAFAGFRWGDVAVLRCCRQLVEQPFVNPQDNAMTPNTFEGVTLGGKVAGVEYFAGYLARIKTRNADRFVAMSEAAGAAGTDGAVALGGVKGQPLSGLTVELAEQYGADTFNTLFARVEYGLPLGEETKLQLGAQFTDQRAVGEALVAPAHDERWVTRYGSARAALGWRGLTLRTAASLTAEGNELQHPWGFPPGYLTLTQQQFNSAGERAWRVGAAYEFPERLAPGLSAEIDLAWGVGAIHPVTRAPLPDEAEYDLVVTYAPPWVEGLRLRLRAVVYDREDAARLSHQVRLIANWDLPLLRASR